MSDIRGTKRLAPAAVFAEHCRRGELAYQVGPTRAPVFPPRMAEPRSGAPLEWRVSRGAGAVYATTTVHARGESPRNIALVQLDEGFRMMSSVVGIPPAEVNVGMRVEVFFRDDLPFFRAAT